MNQQDVKTLYMLLKKVSFLYKLSIDDINLLMSRFRKLPFKKGKVIVKQGERGDSFFLVAEGSVSVWIKRADNRKIMVKQLFPGDYFGEMSLLTGERRTATVITEEKSVLYGLAKSSFKRILTKNPSIIESIGNEVAIRKGQLDQDQSRAIETESMAKRISKFFNLS